MTRLRSPKFLRYAAVTVVSVVAGQALLAVAYGVLRWPVVVANVAATAIISGPAYVANRTWVWQKSGRSNFMREVLPFWSIAAIGLLASTLAVDASARIAGTMTGDRALKTAAVILASCFAYGFVWILRYVILDRFIFSGRGLHRRFRRLDISDTATELDLNPEVTGR
jgi:putative flippase GtrA